VQKDVEVVSQEQGRGAGGESLVVVEVAEEAPERGGVRDRGVGRDVVPPAVNECR
jgi:hypothetical protein